MRPSPSLVLGWLAMAVRPRVQRPPVNELELHLMRCRRRTEPAAILAARLRTTDAAAVRRAIRCCRLTDSVAVRRTWFGYEIAGVFDDGTQHDGLERRLRAALGAGDLQLGWARFPDDGFVLDALLQAARARVPEFPARPARPSALQPAGASLGGERK